ncbi:TIGR00730 family Rossman fold protein, partial [Staphylococcus hominis]
NNYYSLIEQFYDQMVSNEFLTQEDRDKILFSNSFQEIEEFIEKYKAPNVRTY